MKIFKLKIGKVGLLLSSMFFMTQGYAQKTSVVSAALEFQNYQESFRQQNLEEAKKHLLEAKKLIDPTMTNERTANEPKANYYNAIINFSLVELSAKYSDLKIYQSDSVLDVIKASAKLTHQKSRWKKELEDFFGRKTNRAIKLGQMMYEKDKYKMAFYGFSGAYQIKKIAGIEKNQEQLRTNSVVTARKYIDTLQKQGKIEEALKFTSQALKVLPKSEEIAIDGVNLALGNNDIKKAEEFFAIVAESSPKNKELFSSMGSIFLNAANTANAQLKEMEETAEDYQKKSKQVDALYEKAESNLKRALKIDSNYVDAAYNLGVLYLNKGERLKTRANKMDFNNPNYKKIKQKSKEAYKNAIKPLEIYIKHDPNNAAVLKVLFQVYRNTGNTEKAKEYRERAKEAAAKQGQ